MIKKPIFIVALTVVVFLLVAVAGLGFYYYQVNLKLDALSQQLQALNEKTSHLAQNILDTSDIYTRIEKSVVKIEVRQNSGEDVSGSGFIFDSLGHIVTNNHVVGNSNKIEVVFSDGNILKAGFVGGDVYSDLAVIKLAEPVTAYPLTLADSDTLKVGDAVIAVGSPFGLGGSVTSGIVSQKGRLLALEVGYSIPDIIQFDAAINKGNSGGPLLNSKSEVVGVTTALTFSGGIPAFAGVGFAISSNMIAKVIPSLIEKGKYEHSWLGINVTSLTPVIVEAMGLKVCRGLLITEVLEDSPAQKAGLKGGSTQLIVGDGSINVGGDIVIGIDAVDIKSVEDLLSYLGRKNPGDEATLRIIRDGAEQSVTLTLGVRPLPLEQSPQD